MTTKPRLFVDVLKEKDAQGHGSNSKGGSLARPGFPEQRDKAVLGAKATGLTLHGGDHEAAFRAHDQAFHAHMGHGTPVKVRGPVSATDKKLGEAHQASAMAHLSSHQGPNPYSPHDVRNAHLAAAKKWEATGNMSMASAHTKMAGGVHKSAPDPEAFAREILALAAEAVEKDLPAEDVEARLTALVKGFTAEPQADDTIRVLKADPEQQIVWGWALVSVEKGQPVTDLQGDVVATSELQRAVHETYIGSGRIGKDSHRGGPVGEVVDSIVFTKELQDALGIDLGKEGWFVGMKIHKKDVWEAVKRGELSAFSIGGEGERHPLSKEKDSKGHGSNARGPTESLAGFLQRQTENNNQRSFNASQRASYAKEEQAIHDARTKVREHRGTGDTAAAHKHLDRAIAAHDAGKPSSGHVFRALAALKKSESPLLFEDVLKGSSPMEAKYMAGLIDHTTQRATGLSQRFMTAQAEGKIKDAGAHKKHMTPVHESLRDAHQHNRSGDAKKAQACLTSANRGMDDAEHELQFTYGADDTAGKAVKKARLFFGFLKAKDAKGHGSNSHVTKTP